jgi:hypothetical protein
VGDLAAGNKYRFQWWAASLVKGGENVNAAMVLSNNSRKPILAFS